MEFGGINPKVGGINSTFGGIPTKFGGNPAQISGIPKITYPLFLTLLKRPAIRKLICIPLKLLI